MTLPLGFPPKSNRIDDKLAHLDIALAEFVRLGGDASLPAKQRTDLFAYHFAAFIGAAGAIRQYLQDDLKANKQIGQGVDTQGSLWFDDFNDQTDIATVIGLRNTDVHDLTIQSSGLKPNEINTTFASLLMGYRIRYKHFDWVRARFDVVRKQLRVRLTPPARPVPATITTSTTFHLDPTHLGQQFMCAVYSSPTHFSPSRAAKQRYIVGAPLRQQAAAITCLRARDLTGIATDARSEMRTRIADARSRKLIP